MGFEINLNLFGKEHLIPDTIVNVWLVTIAILIFAAIVNRKLKKSNDLDVPSGFINAVELSVESIQGLIKQTMGDHLEFGPFIYTIVIFLLCANLSGLIGLTPPTSDYSVTLTMALITFFLTQFYGLKNNGLGGYLKGFTEPMAFLTPLNIIGELANPISLSFRLFGNIVSGVIIMGLFYEAVGILAPLIAPPFHAYFDIFSGVLQSFIFAMLTMIFVGGNLED